MTFRSAVMGLSIALMAYVAIPGAVVQAQAQSQEGCVVVNQTPPDEEGSYTIVYRCNGKRIVATYSCKNTYCVWDYREEQ